MWWARFYYLCAKNEAVKMEHAEVKLSSQPIFEGKVISVTRDEVRLENGNTSFREVVHHHGGAAVIALTENDEIYMVRQYRYAVGEELLEIPAGKLEKGEDPFEAAKRELAEEAGLYADTYVSLGYIIPTCGYCDEKIYIYAAKGLHPTQQHLDADEFLSVFKVKLSEAIEKVMSGEIVDSKTIAALMKIRLLQRK